MYVSRALQERTSIRAFLDKPVPDHVLKRIFGLSQMSPSNCNVQPWQVYVVSGKEQEALKEKLVAEVKKGHPPNPDFNWEIKYEGVHRDRQFGAAFALYGSMGIERQDKEGRMKAMLRNWEFFGAPHTVFFTMAKYMNIMGAVDLGIYAQSLALLMTDEGISSCMQGALGQYPDPIREHLNIPGDIGILFGMSFGYADPSEPVNTTRTDRVPLDAAVNFLG